MNILLKIVLIASFLTVFSINLYSGEWVCIDTMHTYITNEWMSCLDKDNCITVGNYEGPVIRLTHDGGKSWKNTISDPFAVKAYIVKYLTADKIVIAGEKGTGYYSNDSGNSWKKFQANTPSDMWDIAIQKKRIYFTGVKQVFFTDDEFKTIDTLELPSFNIGKSISFDRIYSFGSDTLLLEWGDWKSISDFPYSTLVSSNYMISKDGGISWDTYQIQKFLYGCHFFDSKNAVGNFKIREDSGKDKIFFVKTKDGFKTMDTVQISYVAPYTGLYKMKFYNSQYGVALGKWNNLWSTQDSGKTWQQDSSFNSMKFTAFRDIEIIGPKEYIAVEELRGFIYKYSDKVSEVINDKYNYNNSLIYPNPAGDYINIYVAAGSKPALENQGIEIFNIFGEKIPPRHFALQNATPQEGNFKIDVSNLVPGVYFIKIGDKIEKFIKM